MNAYVVCIPEIRDGSSYGEPPDPGLPISVVAAESRGRAKSLVFRKWVKEYRSGVYSDDFTYIRTRLLARHVRRPEGEYSGTDSIWALIPRDWPQIKGAGK